MARNIVEIEFVDDPVILVLYAVSGALVELLGSMFWAALIILFIRAELFTRLSRELAIRQMLRRT